MKQKTQAGILRKTFPELRWRQVTTSCWLGLSYEDPTRVCRLSVAVQKQVVGWYLDQMPFTRLGQGTVADGLQSAAPLLRILYDACVARAA